MNHYGLFVRLPVINAKTYSQLAIVYMRTVVYDWLNLCKVGFMHLWFLWLKMWCQTGRHSIALSVCCLYW